MDSSLINFFMSQISDRTYIMIIMRIILIIIIIIIKRYIPDE